MEKQKRTTSIIWNYFNKLAAGQVKCTICFKIYSHTSSSSNLLRHLKLKHPQIIHQRITATKYEIEKTKENKKVSGVWKYFNRIAPDLVKCEFCSNIFLFNITSTPNLRKHLQRHLLRKNQPSAVAKTAIMAESSNGIIEDKRKRSSVWKYFNKEGPMHVRCRFCSNVYSFKSRTISNLSRHIALKHPFKTEEIENGKTEEIENFNENTVTPDNNELQTVAASGEYPSDIEDTIINDNTKSLNNLLLRFVVKNYHPFEVIQQKEFKEFIFQLNSEYKIPTAREMSTSILDEVYNSKVLEIKESLAVASSCSITVNEWLSVTNDKFLSVTVHYIDNQCQLHSSLLDCFMCVGNCTGENIAEGINDICQTWEIDNKIVAIVSPKSSIIEAAANILSWPYISCFSHALITIVNDALLVIKQITKKIDDVFNFFKKNSFALIHLQSVQENVNCSEEILNIDVCKKWNTEILMYEILLRNKVSIVATLNVLEQELLITDEEFQALEKINEILKPFLEAITEVNSKNQINVSKTILFTHKLRKFLDKYESEPIEYVDAFLEKLKVELRNLLEYTETVPFFAEATLLDPRFKQQGFFNRELYHSTRNSISEKLQNTIYFPTMCETDKISQEYEESSSSLWDDFDNGVEKFSKTCLFTAGKLELDRYTEEMLLSRKENPLEWWKKKEIYYPNLYHLMKKILCISGSTAFRDIHYTFTEKINTSTNLPKLLFLNNNL